MKHPSAGTTLFGALGDESRDGNGVGLMNERGGSGNAFCRRESRNGNCAVRTDRPGREGKGLRGIGIVLIFKGAQTYTRDRENEPK